MHILWAIQLFVQGTQFAAILLSGFKISIIILHVQNLKRSCCSVWRNLTLSCLFYTEMLWSAFKYSTRTFFFFVVLGTSTQHVQIFPLSLLGHTAINNTLYPLNDWNCMLWQYVVNLIWYALANCWCWVYWSLCRFVGNFFF